ncbi:MAG: hypothetical protein IPL73_04270 [Candidatus Obscuribacter sp.]|nr:hypothetical protein [Candidatus Obscuribacter sp.]
MPNKNLELEPGMFAEVIWHMERPYSTLFVPSFAILSREDRTFVALVKGGVAQLVQVSRGQPMGKLVEVVGSLQAGDEVVLNPTSDLSGARINVHRLSNTELEKMLTESSKED